MEANAILPIPGFQEPVSSMLHLFGAGLFLVLGIILLIKGRGDRTRLIYLGIYVLSTIFLMSMSGVYHLLDFHAGREVMRRLDYAAIYVLIAGTFTPPHGILLKGIWRWGMLLLIWTLAITGLTLHVIFFEELQAVYWLVITFFLGMGWLGAISGIKLKMEYGSWFIMPLFWGAIGYTLGAGIEFMKSPVIIPGVLGPHELFHIAIIIAALFHWSFIYQFADGKVTLRQPISQVKANEPAQQPIEKL